MYLKQNIQMVFHNTFSDYTSFKLSKGSRPWHTLLLISDGSFRFTANGQVFDIGKNDIAFFPQNQYFEREVLSSIAFHQLGFFLHEDTPQAASLSVGKLMLPKSHVRTILDSLDLLSTYFSHENPSIYRPLISQIIFENDLYCAQESRLPITQDNDVSYVIQYMSEHLSEKISIRMLAASLHLSYNGLLWKFKTQMNRTPDEFLIMLRMRYAKQLIMENKLRINEIAQRCGYANAYYFSNAFKKSFGCSPCDYRKKNQL